MEPVILRSNRKTLSMSFTDQGLVVRAPLRCSRARIDAFLLSHQAWLARQEEAFLRRQAQLASIPPLTPDELEALRRKGREVFPARVAHYAPLVGVEVSSVTVRAQKSRWGSCSARGGLSFNCLLLLAPEEVLDSVVVHELCHRKFMNHSKDFYGEIDRVFPLYNSCRVWLKEHGDELLRRLPRT